MRRPITPQQRQRAQRHRAGRDKGRVHSSRGHRRGKHRSRHPTASNPRPTEAASDAGHAVLNVRVHVQGVARFHTPKLRAWTAVDGAVELMVSRPSVVDIHLNVGWVATIEHSEGVREYEERVTSLRVVHAARVKGAQRFPWSLDWPPGPVSLRGAHTIRWFIEAVVRVNGEAEPAQSRRWVTVLPHTIAVRKDVTPPSPVAPVDIQVSPSYPPAEGHMQPPSIPVLEVDACPDTGSWGDVLTWQPTAVRVGSGDGGCTYDESSLRRIEVSRDATHLFVTLASTAQRRTLQTELPAVDLEGLPWLARRGVDVPLTAAQAVYQVVCGWGMSPARWFEEDTHAPNARDDDTHTPLPPVVDDYEGWWRDKTGVDETIQAALADWAHAFGAPRGHLAWRSPEHAQGRQRVVAASGLVGLGGVVLSAIAGVLWGLAWVAAGTLSGTLWWLWTRTRVRVPPPPERAFTSIVEDETWGDVGLIASAVVSLGEIVAAEVTVRPRHPLTEVVVQWSLRAMLQSFDGQRWREHQVHEARGEHTCDALAAGRPYTLAWQRRVPKRTLVSFDASRVRGVWSLEVELVGLNGPVSLSQRIGVLPVVVAR